MEFFFDADYGHCSLFDLNNSLNIRNTKSEVDLLLETVPGSISKYSIDWNLVSQKLPGKTAEGWEEVWSKIPQNSKEGDRKTEIIHNTLNKAAADIAETECMSPYEGKLTIEERKHVFQVIPECAPKGILDWEAVRKSLHNEQITAKDCEHCWSCVRRGYVDYQYKSAACRQIFKKYGRMLIPFTQLVEERKEKEPIQAKVKTIVNWKFAPQERLVKEKYNKIHKNPQAKRKRKESPPSIVVEKTADLGRNLFSLGSPNSAVEDEFYWF